MTKDIWKTVNDLNKEYDLLNLNNTVLDYEKYKLYSIVTSSTQLEGSTLTEVDTQLLLDEGLTAKGKPLEHHLMVQDNYEAIKYAMKSADEQMLLSPDFLKKLNALNMSQTGTTVNSPLGTIDGKTGSFRLVNAFSEALGYYQDPKKIPHSVELFCKDYNQQLTNNKGIALLKSSFDAHATLIMIHPWQDGNKRTSRLLMNFMQQRGGLPLTKVHKEDSRQYLDALKELKDTGDFEAIRSFMAYQHVKTISAEIENYKQINSKKNNSFYFL